MVLEKQLPDFLTWLLPHGASPGGLIMFVVIVFMMMLVATLFAYLVAALRQGPSEAFYVVAGAIKTGVIELCQTSPRRVYAMSMLAVQEAIRNKVLVVFALFVTLLLFAGWFLDVKNDNPAKLYLGFVLSSANYLVLMLGLFLSAFSLPLDIKNKTIYTVVTKPVRASEIVLGRIFGFGAVGTVILMVMCVASYGFVVRGLSHDHVIDPADKEQTSFDSHHRHTVTYNEDGTAITDTVMGHWHEVKNSGTASDPQYVVGAPQGALQARVPVYGSLAFLDRKGLQGQGINVGYEWGYRKYIEGNTGSAAIWTFAGVTEDNFPGGLPVEMTLSVFRTYKGDINKGITGVIQLRNPRPKQDGFLYSDRIGFTSKEFSTLQLAIPKELTAFKEDGSSQKVNIFEELTHDGQLEIWVQCSESAQFFGMAGPDLYLRAANSNFLLNFLKSHLGMWFQMVIVICFGVMFSTILNGPVGMLATATAVTLGFCQQFVRDVVSGEIQGGGTVESLIRIVTQDNVVVEMEQSGQTTIIQSVDGVYGVIVSSLASSLPNLHDFNTSAFVANGFDIGSNVIIIQASITFAFFISLSIASYFLLKTRELAG